MGLLVNDLSIHGQFTDVSAFKDSIDRLMKMRQIAQQYGRELYCHHKLANVQVTRDLNLKQAMQNFSRPQQQAVMQWLTRSGPFWEDERLHGPDDWFEVGSDIVTDTALAEAAWCCENGIQRNVVSLVPSDWQMSPILVDWLTATGNRKQVEVANYWEVLALEAYLKALPMPLASWAQLERVARSRFTALHLTTYAFEPLNGHPFVSSAADRLLAVLDVLNQFVTCFDAEGHRTTKGHEIYQDFFTGKKGDGGRGSMFSDSSDSEKNKFEGALTFVHPERPGEYLFCPWHGKIQTPQYRVHFSYPIKATEPTYVVYVGPKITV